MKKRTKLSIAATILVVVVGYGVATYAYNANMKSERVVQPTLTIQAPEEYTRQELLDQTNLRRITPLVLDPVLNESAQKKCLDIVKRGDFNHGDVSTIANEIGRTVSENIATGQVSEAQVVMEWMASPAHRAALVDERWVRVGFGICVFKGEAMVVQHLTEAPDQQSVNGAATNSTASVRNVDLNPYKYSVAPDAGDTGFETPKVEVNDYQSTVKPYQAKPPTVTMPPSDNCHTVLNC